MDSSIALALIIAVCYVGSQLAVVKVAIDELGDAISDVDRKIE